MAARVAPSPSGDLATTSSRARFRARVEVIMFSYGSCQAVGSGPG